MIHTDNHITDHNIFIHSHLTHIIMWFFRWFNKISAFENGISISNNTFRYIVKLNNNNWSIVVSMFWSEICFHVYCIHKVSIRLTVVDRRRNIYFLLKLNENLQMCSVCVCDVCKPLCDVAYSNFKSTNKYTERDMWNMSFYFEFGTLGWMYK